MSEFQFYPISCDSSQRCNEQSVAKGDKVTDNYTKQPQTNKQMENKKASASPLILVCWGFPGSISGPIAVKGCKRPWVSWRSFVFVLPNLLDASHITCPPGRSPIRSVCGIKWRRHPWFDWTNHLSVTFTAGKSDFLTTGAASLVTASSLLVLKLHDLSSPTFSWGRIAHQNLWTQHQSKKPLKNVLKGFCACSWALMSFSHPICPSYVHHVAQSWDGAMLHVASFPSNHITDTHEMLPLTWPEPKGWFNHLDPTWDISPFSDKVVLTTGPLSISASKSNLYVCFLRTELKRMHFFKQMHGHNLP